MIPPPLDGLSWMVSPAWSTPSARGMAVPDGLSGVTAYPAVD